jgi:anti-sigma factor RsiW
MVVMCPEREMISEYFDGELPSPWKEKMERHLETCAQCRACLDSYRKLSRILDAPSAAAEDKEAPGAFEARLQSARRSLWEKLEGVYTFSPEAAPRPSLWRRSLSIPLPAAAAAALLIFAVAFFALIRPLSRPPEPNQSALASIESDIQGIVPVADMSRVLQYLDQEDSGGDIVIIRLPESRNFSSSGEPTLIKAVDYTRRNQPR